MTQKARDGQDNRQSMARTHARIISTSKFASWVTKSGTLRTPVGERYLDLSAMSTINTLRRCKVHHPFSSQGYTSSAECTRYRQQVLSCRHFRGSSCGFRCRGYSFWDTWPVSVCNSPFFHAYIFPQGPRTSLLLVERSC